MLIVMSASIVLPSTKNIDTLIQKHFVKVCKLKDSLAELERKSTATLAAMASSGKKRGSNGVLKQELVYSSSSLQTQFVNECKILGQYLGKRLHDKYSKVITSMLTGTDGFAILDLVPGSRSSFWDDKRKKELLSLFWMELQSHLCSIESIQPTFCQVNMRKTKESFLDGPNAPPLSSSFFKALKGKKETLFPYHVFQSFQLLQTSAGVPVPIAPETKKNSKERFEKFQHNAAVLLKRNQLASKKKAVVRKHFLEPPPHLVRFCICFAVIWHLVINCVSVVICVLNCRTMMMNS
jgi:hypothetical protein